MLQTDSDANIIISKFKDFSKEDKINLLQILINDIKKIYGIRGHSIEDNELMIPIGIFGNDKLSSLESIVKYSKEELQLKFSKIAKMLNRSIKTVWTTYKNASRKMPKHFESFQDNIIIPYSAFSDRNFSTLESLVGFIKNLGRSNHEVGLMLHLDDRTIWTVYDRVKRKIGIKNVRK